MRLERWIIAGAIAASLLGSRASGISNDYHLVLNGFSQEVHASDGYTGILGTRGRTLSWWYRSHDASFPTVWGLVFWGHRWVVHVESFESGSIILEIQGAKIAWSAQRNPAMASLQDGQWHQIAMTAPEAGTLEDVRLYLDGVLVPAVSVVNGSLTRAYDTTPCCTFRVGARDLGNHADADMDEVALWDVELSASAVAEIFNGGIPTDLTQVGSSYTDVANLRLYWRFEEGSGPATSDVSGNGHGGDLIAGGPGSWGTNPPGSGSDSDGDGILDGFDNCPGESNPGQEDGDSDGIGDVCDPFPAFDDNDHAQCDADLAEALAALDQCVNPPTQCSDGLDNDGDGGVDFDGGESALGAVVAEADLECIGKPWRNRETPSSRCGLGFEVALLLPLLGWARHRFWGRLNTRVWGVNHGTLWL
jgi:hypothetical protein